MIYNELVECVHLVNLQPVRCKFNRNNNPPLINKINYFEKCNNFKFQKIDLYMKNFQKCLKENIKMMLNTTKYVF